MGTIVTGAGAYANSASLSAAQTGNGQSTNIVDRGGSTGPALVTIVTTVGSTPTCTYLLEVSADGVDWFPGAYADVAAPTTTSVATFAITSATTTRKVMVAGQPWRFLRVTFSANTNVTSTVTVWAY
ncbi:hypothetical protein [Amycolatopsis speibonae]|uniref:Discoidin domain-containing protein n=1 Tax=Amycolatopsis speibonae TaxID=1450224 RepID=A0ABV7P4J6_9PSEU